jgi:hypothetical protein
VSVGTGGTYKKEPVGRSVENRQFACESASAVLLYREASVTSVSPGCTETPIQPTGGTHEVVVGGKVLVATGLEVSGMKSSGGEVGVGKIGICAWVCVGVGISGT